MKIFLNEMKKKHSVLGIPKGFRKRIKLNLDDFFLQGNKSFFGGK